MMPSVRKSEPYRILDAPSLVEMLTSLPEVRGLLGGVAEDWRIREVGDGNLNLVFIVEGVLGSVCVKQALPYVRAAGPSWPMSPERAFFENCYYRTVSSHVAGRVPTVHHYDAGLYCTVMERLSPHIILRHGLIAGQRYPKLARDMGEFVAHACFFTSDLALPFERKFEQAARFAANDALIRISVDLIFADPYVASERNRHTSPQLDAVVLDFRRDGPLKLAVARFGRKFLGQSEALLHGDLHSGSVMVTADDTRVIDPEFAFYGPIGFDLGAFFGNLLLSWYSQSGHADTHDDRVAYREWLLEQAAGFWGAFRERFLALWAVHGTGDVFPAALFTSPEEAVLLERARREYLDALLADMVGFAACKMIRRILGFAHVIDFDQIADADRRADCEAGALGLAHLLLTHPDQFRTVDAVIDAVPRMARGQVA